MAQIDLEGRRVMRTLITTQCGRSARLAAVTLLGLTSAMVLAQADTASADQTVYVSTSGDDAASGDATNPFRTINHAVAVAQPGDAIEVRGGVYHESVQVFEKEVHIRAATNANVVLDGADEVSEFVASNGDWYSPGWTTEFETNVGPMVYADEPVAGYPDQVFLDDQPLQQVLSRGSVRPGTFFHDTVRDRLWIGNDPNGRLVEASTLKWGIYLNQADGSSLTNLTVRRYATEFHQEGAVRAYADHLRLSGLTTEYNAYIGTSLIGDDIIVTDGRFRHNGYIGLHGDSLSNVVVDRAVITHNNAEGFSGHHSAAGLKFTRATGIVVRNSDVTDNDGPGLWTDIDSSGITFTGNFVTHNKRSGVQIELSNNVTVSDNVVARSGEAGVWVLESQSVNVWHNAVLDNRHEIYVLEGPRSDVTSVSIRNNIVGDDRHTEFPILTVNDWTHRQPASQMNVSSDHNLYWRLSTAAATYVSWWGRWPDPWARNTTIAEQVATVGQGASSSDRLGGDIPVRDPAAFDYRGDDTVEIGAPLSASVAASLGRTAGEQLRIGPVSTSPALGFSSPVTHGGAGITSLAGSRNGLKRAVRVSN